MWYVPSKDQALPAFSPALSFVANARWGRRAADLARSGRGALFGACLKRARDCAQGLVDGCFDLLQAQAWRAEWDKADIELVPSSAASGADRAKLRCCVGRACYVVAASFVVFGLG